MINSQFCVGGAITDEQEAAYVLREADDAIIAEIQQMHYILVIEPRQQGKTSVANRLMRSHLEDHIFIYLDLTTLDQSSEDSFYSSFRKRFLEQLKKSVTKKSIEPLMNELDIRDFLHNVSKVMQKDQNRLIVILDEIGAVNFQNSTKFFSILRDLYNSRQIQPELRCLTFLLTGAFHPSDLIQNKQISPFNIAHRIRLADFNVDQILSLLGLGTWHDACKPALADRIYYWTSGQPYPVQYICSRLAKNASPQDVDEIISSLRKDDGNLIPPVLERLRENADLHNYLRTILDGEKVKFIPGENKLQAQLELLGVVKADRRGLCQVRNTLYEQVLTDYYVDRKSQSIEAGENIKLKAARAVRYLFRDLPQHIGYFLLDLFGRENAKQQSAIILGYLFIVVLVGILRGLFHLDDVFNIIKDVWSFISGAN